MAQNVARHAIGMQIPTFIKNKKKKKKKKKKKDEYRHVVSYHLYNNDRRYSLIYKIALCYH